MWDALKRIAKGLLDRPDDDHEPAASGDPVEDFRQFMASHLGKVSLPKGRPYGSIRLGQWFELTFHVRRNDVGIFFASRPEVTAEAVLGWIEVQGLAERELAPGYLVRPQRGARNPDVVRIEFSVPMAEPAALYTVGLRKTALALFNALAEALEPIVDDVSAEARAPSPQGIDKVMATRIGQAKDPASTADLLHEICYDERVWGNARSAELAVALFAHPAIAADDMRNGIGAVLDGGWQWDAIGCLKAAATNPNCPHELLARMAAHDDPTVAALAANRGVDCRPTPSTRVDSDERTIGNDSDGDAVTAVAEPTPDAHGASDDLARIHRCLEGIGLDPDVDDDGDIVFHLGEDGCFLFAANLAEGYCRLLAPRVQAFAGQDVPKRAAPAALQVTGGTKVAKVYLHSGDVVAECGVLFTSVDELEAVLERYVSALGQAVDAFREAAVA